MTLIAVAFDPDLPAVRRQISEIEKLRPAVPIVNLVFRMQIVEVPKQRPSDILQKQFLRILMPAFQSSPAFAGARFQMPPQIKGMRSFELVRLRTLSIFHFDSSFK